jgi:hypothetical protein
LGGATTKGNPYLRAILAEVVWAISHTKNNNLSAQYHRLARRLGKKKAVVAVSHSVLVIIYHVLQSKTPSTDLGVDYFDKRDAARIERQHVRRLEQLGYRVTLTPKEVAESRRGEIFVGSKGKISVLNNTSRSFPSW